MRVKPLILGDEVYPSTTWLVEPYPSNIRVTDTQKNLNKSLSSARAIAERGFELLKGHWCCLLKRLNNDTEYVTNLIFSYFVLHNITQIISDKYIDYENLCDIFIRESVTLVYEDTSTLKVFRKMLSYVTY